MEYVTGDEVRPGDIIKMWDGLSGRVVFVVDNSAAVEGFNIADWSYLTHGIVVQTQDAGLVHYEEQKGQIKLLQRL